MRAVERSSDELLTRAAWLTGGGVMGEWVRRFDWSRTPLGPLEEWPASLRALTSMLLHSRQPMLLWWGPQLTQLYNDAFLPSLGAGKHPLSLGQSGRTCWAEAWPVIGKQIDDVLSRGISCYQEDALVPVLRGGKLEDVYWSYGYSPVYDEASRIAGVLVVCNEITAQVRLQERERLTRADTDRERERLLRFFAQAPAGICLLRGPDFTFDFANEQYRALVGRRDIVGKPLLEALPELEGQGFAELLSRVVGTGEAFVGREFLVKLAAEGGDPASLKDVYCTFIYSPLRDLMGNTEGVGVFALDVTEQVLARREVEALAAQLQKSEAEFRTLAASIPQLAWSARPDGFVDWYNRRWYDYTGLSSAEMAALAWQKVLEPSVVEQVTRRWQTALSQGHDFEMEFPLRRADGSFRWHLTRAVPLRDQGGQIVRWFGTSTDIDDVKRAEHERALLLAAAQGARETAEVASRAKDEFLTTASHELRTPLSAILGWARLLRSGKLDPSAYLRAIETIERNATAQVRLIEDILDGSRIISGKLHLEIRRLDLTQLVQAALDAVRPAAEAKSISLSVELDPAASRISGDPERLQQVVWNLANNAIKFTPKGGAVSVRLARDGTDIELVVADNGPGIDPQFLPHVFERFRQAEGSTTRRFGGLGLGLALVRHLVEAHGGTVRAESPGLGAGSTFRARLPVQAVFELQADSVRPSPVPAPPPPVSAGALVGVSVLVVDDEADARDLVATVLRGSGAEVTIAASAAEALELLASQVPMLLLSDVGMPEMDGYELLRRVRSQLGAAGASLPAIALTAYAREEDRRLALAAGFHAHVTKPVEPGDLLRLVAGLTAPRAAGDRASPIPAVFRADTFVKLERILHARGVHEALRFLNSRTPHRFTGIFGFDADVLRSLHLFDSEHPERLRGDDAPLDESYCAIVGASQRSFTTADARHDDRLRAHVARDRVVSYCGVLLRDGAGGSFGTLCHFDRVACDVPTSEMPLMETAALSLMRSLLAANRESD